MNKIKRISQIAKIFFWIGFFVAPLSVAFYWAGGGSFFQAIHFQFYSFPLPQLGGLPMAARFLGFLVTLIPTAFFMLTLYYAATLFSFYEQGKIFDLSAARCIRKIAIVLLAYQIARPIYDMLISFVLTYTTSNPHIRIAFDSSDLTGIIIGIVLFVIGWVMVEANQIKEEQEYTV